MGLWKCKVCDWVYEPTVRDPDSGIKPGTKFTNIPDNWVCPECRVGKDSFFKMEG